MRRLLSMIIAGSLACCMACAAPIQRDDSSGSPQTAIDDGSSNAVDASTATSPSDDATVPATPFETRCTLNAPTADPAWLRDGVGYQIWVRSFSDSNGDGIGDLKGILSKLDYLNDGKPGGDDLGVTVLWLSPIFASPSDHGYDTTDYAKIHPDYGTKADLKALLDAAHQRGMRVMLDLVLNHCSREHPWFIAAGANKTSTYRDWFNWRPDNPGWTQPWGKGGVWHKHANGGYYYGLFWQGMPDLNLANEPTAAALEQIAKDWVVLGVDGYRLDAARYLIETGGGKGQADTAATHAFWRRLRKTLTGVKADVALVGEVWTATKTIATYLQGDELHGAFDFDSCSGLRQAVEMNAPGPWRTPLCASSAVTGGVWGRFAGNHDMPRLADSADTPGMLKLALAAVVLLPGTPWIYQGDELGLPSGPTGGDRRYRLPLPWTAKAPGFGFTSGTPWMAAPASYGSKSVAKQAQDGLSAMRWVQQLVALRHKMAPFREGPARVLRLDSRLKGEADARVVAMELGSSPGSRAVLVFNFSAETAFVAPPALIAGGTRVLAFSSAQLAPAKAAIVSAPGVGVWQFGAP